jgi:hypothetical protein
MEILSANALAPHAQDFGSNSEWQVLINKLNAYACGFTDKICKSLNPNEESPD